MYVQITDENTGTQYGKGFDSKEECEIWVKEEKKKFKDHIIFSETHIPNSEIVYKKEKNGNVTYKLRLKPSYKIEYLEYHVSQAPKYKEEFKKAWKQILSDTDWSQLPDVELTTEQRQQYREYRKYVRNKRNDYTDSDIYKWKILSFEEFKKLKGYVK